MVTLCEVGAIAAGVGVTAAWRTVTGCGAVRVVSNFTSWDAEVVPWWFWWWFGAIEVTGIPVKVICCELIVARGEGEGEIWTNGGVEGKPFNAGINEVGECKLTDDGLWGEPRPLWLCE